MKHREREEESEAKAEKGSLRIGNVRDSDREIINFRSRMLSRTIYKFCSRW